MRTLKSELEDFAVANRRVANGKQLVDVAAKRLVHAIGDPGYIEALESSLSCLKQTLQVLVEHRNRLERSIEAKRALKW
jgi:hypothetical protein